MTIATPQILAQQIDGPQPSPAFLARESRGDISPQQGKTYRAFLRRVVREFLTHPVVVSNPYIRWFRRGEATDEELRHFTVQFSVFSNQFLVAQLMKMIAADTLEGMRAAKEILANEIGCLVIIKADRHPDLHLGFWMWHNRLEAQHAGHTIAELEDIYFRPGFSEDKFLEGGRAMLDALSAFWFGLDRDRVYARGAEAHRGNGRPMGPTVKDRAPS